MINLIPLAIKYRHLIGYGALVVACLSAVWYIHHQGYKACQREILALSAEKTKNSIETRKGIEHETKSMDRDLLIDDLRRAGELRQADDY